MQYAGADKLQELGGRMMRYFGQHFENEYLHFSVLSLNKI